MKKIAASIGIPVFNEEANIKNLLLSLLQQKDKNFTLKEIIVVSDSSTDSTDLEVKRVKSKKIKLIKNRKRLGQAAGQNKIVKRFKGDVLILLNGDVLPKNDNFISELIKPFRSRSVGLVGPRIIPVEAKTYFEEIINFSIKLKEAIFEGHNNGENIYLCSGRGRAFSKDLAKKIIWKESLSEDAYSYLFCLENGYKFKYTSNAKLLFKSPDNFNDHIKQSARFLTGSETLLNFFNYDLLKRSYRIPLLRAIRISFLYLIKNPTTFISYTLVLLLIKFSPKKSQYANSKWQPSISSKALT